MSTITLTTQWKQIYSIAAAPDDQGRTWTAQCWMKYNSQSVANNTTTIEWGIYVYSTEKYGPDYGSYYNYTQKFGLWLDDTYNLYTNNNVKIGYVQDGSYTTIATGTKTIPHNSDGTYTETVWFKGSTWGFTETAEYTNSIALPTIPRASTFTVSPTSVVANGSNQVAISITKASSGFTHTLKWAYSSGSVSVNTTIATKTSNSSVTWTPATSLFNNATNLTQMAGTLTCETYNGNTKVGQKTKTVTLKINEDSFTPTISDATCTEAGSISTTGITGWTTVNLLSKKNLSVSFSIKSGATVSSVTCSVGNVSNKAMTVSGSSATCTINYPTAAVYTFKVTDSRGYVATRTFGATSDWIAYKKPSVSAISAERDDTTPTTALLSSNGTYWNGTIGNTSNTVTYKVQNGSTTLTNGGTPTTASSGNWTLSNYSLTSLSEDTIYSIKVTVTDSFSQTAESTIAIKKVAADPLWIGKESVIVNDFMVKGRALLTDYTQTYFVDMTPVWWVGDFVSPFGNYISDSTNDPTGLYNRPRVYKQGNLVCIRGAATIISSPGSSTATMFTLPAAFRPNRTQYCICQGSNMNRWMLSVGEDGLVKCARYGTTAGSPPTLPDSGQWLVFSFTYPIKIEPADSYYSV